MPKLFPIEHAVTGPRSLRDPRSREYAIQVMQSLKRYLESKSLDAKAIDEELQLIIRHKHWQICGFKDLDSYLRAEVGTTHKELRHRLAQDLAADPSVTPAAPPRTAGPGRGKTGANSTRFPRGSTQANYLVRRLKRDAPDIAEALARGEYRSARAAGIAAGIVKPKTPLQELRRIWRKASAADRETFLTELDVMGEPRKLP